VKKSITCPRDLFDFEGKFTLKVVNTQDELRFSYVRYRTEKVAIEGIRYDVRLQPVDQTEPDQMDVMDVDEVLKLPCGH
jgi:hypothetical protein